jgi:uncharacterized protein (DUF1778 family)
MPKQILISCRVTEEQQAAIKDCADRLGLSITAFIRTAALRSVEFENTKRAA